MNVLQLEELLRNGESSTVEFKEDDVDGRKLAIELAALCNHRGGLLLLGVDDHGVVTGLTRDRREAEAWVMNICQDAVQPPLLADWEVVRWSDDLEVGVVSIRDGDAPDKPYKARGRKGGEWVTYVRVGTTSRPATRQQEARLYQRADLLRTELRPVRRAILADLDLGRLEHYFTRIRQQEWPDDPVRLLLNTELMVDHEVGAVPSFAGMLLFGREPRRFLPQAGVSVTAYQGTEKDYDFVERDTLTGPLTPSGESGHAGVGLIDQAMAFVARHNPLAASLEGGRSERHPTRWPTAAVREAIVNALIHRDYSISGADVEVNLFSDRLEVTSPGALPNSMTIERMTAGTRYSRNSLLTDVLRDYDYVDRTGLGVLHKMVRGMRAFNNTEPVFEEAHERLTVTLYAGPPAELAAGRGGGQEGLW